MDDTRSGDRPSTTRTRCGTLLIGVSLASAALAADFSGPVVSILDGDTIEVLHNYRPVRIRLSGIDCPEKGQAYGQRAKQTASALVFGKEVTLQTYGTDTYGRRRVAARHAAQDAGARYVTHLQRRAALDEHRARRRALRLSQRDPAGTGRDDV